MNGSHFDTQTQRERTCSLVHGTWRCVGAKIACAGACALMAGQLLLPSVALATECADSAAATGEVAAAPVTPTVAGDTAAPALASADSTASVADAASATPSTAEPQQDRQDAPAATANEAAAADQDGSLDGAGAPAADDAIMPCGVTDTTEKPGGVKINTTVVDHYTDCVLPSNVTLVAAENEALESLTVENVKTDYAPGEAPRATATIPAVDADKYEIAYECWEEMDGSDPTELTPVAFWYSDPAKYIPGMKKIDHFEEGKFYMYSVELRLKDGFTVADDCDMNVNGYWTHHIKTVNSVFAPNAANMLCEQPIDEWRAIDVIEINGATTTFKAGDKPVFTADVPDGSHSLPQCEFWTGSDGSDVNSQKFWDQNITNHIDAFKPGVTYRYGLYLKPARGFYFTPNTKLKINGVECGYQMDEASVVDPDSGWIHTLWLSTDLTFTPEATPAPDPQPTPDLKPTPQPEVKPEAKPEQKPETKPAAKTVEKTTPVKKSEAVLAATGDAAAMTVAALGIAGATVAAAGVATAKRRKR